MMNVKYRFEDFLLFDYAGVEEHLAKMAAKGWRLEKPGSCLWKYRRAEPARVTYAVTYIPDASDFNPQPTKSQRTLQDICEEAGWEKVTDWFQMQIYATEQENPVPLETDEALRLQVIRRSMWKNFIPSNIFLMLVLLVYLWFRLPQAVLEIGRPYIVYTAWVTVLLLFTALVLVTVNLISYGMWSSQSEKLVEQGSGCARARLYRSTGRAAMAVVAGLVAVWLFQLLQNSKSGMVAYALFYELIIVLLVCAMRGMRKWLRSLGAPKWVNITLTFFMNFLLAFLFIGILSFLAFRGGWFR